MTNPKKASNQGSARPRRSKCKGRPCACCLSASRLLSCCRGFTTFWFAGVSPRFLRFSCRLTPSLQALVTAAAASQGVKTRVAVFPFAWVRRATAAAAVNATVRSFIGRCRHSKLRNLCDIRLRSRSVIVMQRWWRWSVCMKHRLNFLRSLRQSLHALGGGKILMAERQTLEDLDIDRAESSSQLLLETKCEPAVAAGTGPRVMLKAVRFDMMCNRRLVPKWVNFEPKDTEQTAAGSIKSPP